MSNKVSYFWGFFKWTTIHDIKKEASGSQIPLFETDIWKALINQDTLIDQALPLPNLSHQPL
jgi:hypothetical protein